MHIETLAVHGGVPGDEVHGSITTPIYQTAAYAFESADHAAALFNLEADGYRYSRISNPTNAALERRIAALEHGIEALVVSSGQAALYYAVMNVVSPGQNVVSTPQLYGTTHTLFCHLLPAIGIKVRFAATESASDVAQEIDGDTRAIFCETIGNPAGNVCDIERMAEVAHGAGVPLIVDNTIASPILLRPIVYGADIVVHSLTKFLGGHGATLGGAVIDGGSFHWASYPDKFPMFSQPDASYHGLTYSDHFGASAYLARCRSTYLRLTGACLSPMSAFLLLQGIETVALRVERQVDNARRVAAFLMNDPRVAWVNYAGHTSHPSYEAVQKYLGGRAASVLTFGVAGGFEQAKKFYDALHLIKRVVNLGDVRTLACHPASTTHRQMTDEQQRAAGVTPDAIRMSVGIEQIDDICADIEQALGGAGSMCCSLTEAA